MKTEILTKLAAFEENLRELKRHVKNHPGDRVTRIAVRREAERVADSWVEELRSPLEHKFRLPPELVETTSNAMRRLHVLSRPNNLKTSYITTVDSVLKSFKDKFVLPIQQFTTLVESKFDLIKLVAGLKADESEYLTEAINCANSGFHRAAIVVGWCSAIDRMRRKVEGLGFPQFNAASTAIKNQTSGKRKKWNKEFNITTPAELQTVFDEDLIIVVEGMGLLDGNQSDRLITVDFQWRNHSAHPGKAPIDDAHVVAFFRDVTSIVLNNPKFSL